MTSKGVILGGVIRYEDGVKTIQGDQFSPTRKVAVELNFAVPEDPGIDEDAVIADVLEKASTFVNLKLGIASATVAAKTTLVKTQTPKAEPTAAVPEAKKRGPKPRVADAAVDPAAVVDVDAKENASVLTESDLAAVENWDIPAQTEITDKEIQIAINKKNDILKDPVPIRALLASFNPDPKKGFQLAQLPQRQRQTFLDKLEALS